MKLSFRCENDYPLRNYFAASYPPSTKIFAAANPPFGTRVPFCSPKPHFATAKPSAKPSKALKSSILLPKPHFTAVKTPAKPLFGTRVPLRSPTPSSATKGGVKVAFGYENRPSLRNDPSLCENPNRHLAFNLTF